MRQLKWVDYVFLALILVLIVQISRNLPLNYDESYHLQIPLRMANEGIYNTIYPWRIFDGFSTIALGPTVLLPVSLIFKLFGIGILTARSVSCLYFIGLISLLWVISIKDQNRIWGAILIGLLLTIPTIFKLGLTVLGEIPCLFLIILGISLWKPNERNFVALSCFGLAAITKIYIYIFALPIIFMIMFQGQRNTVPLMERIERIIISLNIFIIPTIIWEIAKFVSIGATKYPEYLKEIYSFVFLRGDPRFLIHSSPLDIWLRFINIAEQVFWGMPYWITGFLFVIVIFFNILKLVKNDIRNRNLFYFITFLTYFSWVLFISRDGWWRHFFPFAIIFVVLLLDLVRTLWEKLYKIKKLRAILIPFFTIILLIYIMKAGISLHSNIIESSDLSSQWVFANKVKEFNIQGYRFGVMGWWQAPEISFLSGGIKFENIQNNCEKLHNDRYLLIYTKLNEELDPETAEVLRRCIGDAVFSSPNQWYVLYQPRPLR